MKEKLGFKIGFFECALVFFFIIETNYAWGSSQLLHWGSLALLTVGYIAENKGVIDIKPRDYSKWSIGVLIMSFISLLYTIDVSNSINMIKNLVVVFFAFFLIRNYAVDDRKIRFVLNAYLIASLINSIYVLVTVDASVIGEARIGNENMEGWNSNTIGMMSSNAAVV